MSDAISNADKSMDDIMALCKRRGFIYQASEIYGGINGFWDYGPLGAQLKKNLKDAWWQDMVLTPPSGPDGRDVEMVGLDSCIIQNPKVWEASGHVAGFNDPRVDCKESKQRYRADHLFVVKERYDGGANPMFAFIPGDISQELAWRRMAKYQKKEQAEDCHVKPLTDIPVSEFHRVHGPDAKERGTLTAPCAFNLMFKSYAGATATEDDVVYLRPETAQGIFVNFKNVMDTTRVKIPFGIAQMGKAFRNEVTPRNFTFRSREFEQMEIEFFITPDEHLNKGEPTVRDWYTFWRDTRMKWWRGVGLGSTNLQLREHEADELAHYAKTGAGTSDIEYQFPFSAPGYGELEGVADRANFDLTQHTKHSGVKLDVFDQERGAPGSEGGPPKGVRYTPRVIEPSAGADRGTLALLCEAFTPTPERAGSKYVMRFHPRMAPIKAAVFPLVNKDGMPEVAASFIASCASYGMVETDAKQSIGKRYARMDEAGCPYCFTIDGQTLEDQTVTVRDRDTASQERIGIDRVGEYLRERIGG